MYCKKCGKEIADESKFCQHCGERQIGIESGNCEPNKEICQIHNIAKDEQSSQGVVPPDRELKDAVKEVIKESKKSF